MKEEKKFTILDEFLNKIGKKYFAIPTPEAVVTDMASPESNPDNTLSKIDVPLIDGTTLTVDKLAVDGVAMVGVDLASNAKSIRDLSKAMKELKGAQDSVDKSSPAMKELKGAQDSVDKSSPAMKELKGAQDSVDKSSPQFKKLQKAINDTEGKLGDLNDQFRTFSGSGVERTKKGEPAPATSDLSNTPDMQMTSKFYQYDIKKFSSMCMDKSGKDLFTTSDLFTIGSPVFYSVQGPDYTCSYIPAGPTVETADGTIWKIENGLIVDITKPQVSEFNTDVENKTIDTQSLAEFTERIETLEKMLFNVNGKLDASIKRVDEDIKKFNDRPAKVTALEITEDKITKKRTVDGLGINLSGLRKS